MITFKQFLSEEETDTKHENTKLAAEAFIKHCTQWKDIDHPLYRLTDSQDRFSMRTRVPRRRTSDSQGGTREVQEMIFAQPGWEDYPDRLHSIFCSTKKEFAVGDVDEFSENVVVIYPFDGVKIASTIDSNDFNFINLLKLPKVNSMPVMSFQTSIKSMWNLTIGNFSSSLPWREAMQKLKDVWVKDGKFDPTANGNEEYVENYKEMSNSTKETIKFVVEKVPKVWTPEFLGCELVTSSSIDLPGKTREVWFSGKYLAIPWHKWKAFKEDVESLQAGEETKDRSRPKTVSRHPAYK